MTHGQCWYVTSSLPKPNVGRCGSPAMRDRSVRVRFEWWRVLKSADATRASAVFGPALRARDRAGGVAELRAPGRRDLRAAPPAGCLRCVRHPTSREYLRYCNGLREPYADQNHAPI